MNGMARNKIHHSTYHLIWLQKLYGQMCFQRGRMRCKARLSGSPSLGKKVFARDPAGHVKPDILDALSSPLCHQQAVLSHTLSNMCANEMMVRQWRPLAIFKVEAQSMIAHDHLQQQEELLIY